MRHIRERERKRERAEKTPAALYVSRSSRDRASLVGHDDGGCVLCQTRLYGLHKCPRPLRLRQGRLRAQVPVLFAIQDRRLHSLAFSNHAGPARATCACLLFSAATRPKGRPDTRGSQSSPLREDPGFERSADRHVPVGRVRGGRRGLRSKSRV